MAFTIQLGVCRDPKNKLNKTMTDVVSYGCTVKRESTVSPYLGSTHMEGINVMTPQVCLKAGDEIFTKNFAYIPNFHRYYFVQKIEIAPNGIYTIDLSEDVLMSWRDDIKGCEVQLARSADFRNYYLYDNRLPITQRSLTWNKPFSSSPFTETTFDAIVTFIGPSKPTSSPNS